MENMHPNFSMQIFPPAEDKILFLLMDQKEEIATAYVRSKFPRLPTEWETPDTHQAIEVITREWPYGTQKAKLFKEDALKRKLPERPGIYNVRAIPQYGIGDLSFDILFLWSTPFLRLEPKKETNPRIPAEDASGYSWVVGSDKREIAFGVLANTPLSKIIPPGESVFGETLRNLTRFRLLVNTLRELSFPAPETPYVLCASKFASPLTKALFGAIVFTNTFCVMHPEET